MTPAEWGAELGAALGYAVRVEFGRSRSAPVQLRPARPAELREEPALREGWVVRLHEVFAEAPPEVREALASWIRAGRRARRACRELDGWLELALAGLPPRPPRRQSLELQGRVHDLRPLLDDLLATELPGAFDPPAAPPRVTWGRRARSRTRGRLHLGSYSPGAGLVRVHPVLDQHAVPAWLVRYVLFHELLHAALPQERDSAGRLLHHGPRFRERERAYPDYRRALAWEAEHLQRLVRSARAGRPLRRRSPLTTSLRATPPSGRRLG